MCRKDQNSVVGLVLGLSSFILGLRSILLGSRGSTRPSCRSSCAKVVDGAVSQPCPVSVRIPSCGGVSRLSCLTRDRG
jgi:hypothetical protein